MTRSQRQLGRQPDSSPPAGERLNEPKYVPATGRSGRIGLYDLIIATTMRERTFRGRLCEQVLADVTPGTRLQVADVGCGTGTLALQLARAGAHVQGFDGDPRILARATQKPDAETVDWQLGGADRLNLASGSVDRVVFSLVLHHLPDSVKPTALSEALRVLRPGGRVHVADWGPPGDALMRIAFRQLQRVDGRANTQSLADGALPTMLSDAGFSNVVCQDRLRTGWGRLELLSAHKEQR